MKKMHQNILSLIGIAGFLILAVASSGSKTEKEVEKNSLNYTHEVLEKRPNSAVENYFVLIHTEDISKENLQKIALDLRKKLCSGKCNISLYDDKQAWELEKAYEELEYSLGQKLTNGELSQKSYQKELSKWEKKNYCNMADHSLGMLSFESDDLWYYPMKDSKYKELGGKNPEK